MTGTGPGRTTDRIPEPPALPLVGHALGIPSGADALHYVMARAGELGPIFRVRIFNTELIFVSGADLVAELSDNTRFRKSLYPDLVRLRDIGGDGLFTAFNEEANWRKAHDILLPSFSLEAMRGYHTTMVQVARDLLARWDTHAASGRPVDVAPDMTRLTFDTIGRCGFGFDFGSFERDEPHPFVGAMVRALDHAQEAGETLPALQRLRRRRNRQYHEDIALMKDLVETVIRERRDTDPTRTDDLLGRMLNTPDKVTGAPLDDANIRNQVITFLIAGHETTSGALSFALHYLGKHPAVLAKAQEEVDTVWGVADDVEPGYADIGRLTYIRQVLNEALRLWPTAPAYAVEPIEDTVIGGRYAARRGQSFLIFTPQLHRSPEWGDSVEAFDPERFSVERTEARPVHLFKPFGNGERACIGRQFALHEATLVLALLVHRYRLDDHADYRLRITQTLTIKPEGLTLRLTRRVPADRRPRLERSRAAEPAPVPNPSPRPAAQGSLLVLHGSNLGTSAGIARNLAAQADDFGFTTRVASLDDAVGGLTPGSAAVIVASSYNGAPTDDAVRFFEWAGALAPDSLDGVRYAVLGVGDRNWASTYQHVPTVLDDRLAYAGATRLLDRGQADVSGNFTESVDRWTGGLWAALLEEAPAPTDGDRQSGSPFSIEPAEEVNEPALCRQHGLHELTVAESGELVDMNHRFGRSKRFVRLRLPTGIRYRTGDHLAVLPRNRTELVERVGTRLGVDLDTPVVIRPRRRTSVLVPTDQPVTMRTVLSEYVELQEPATSEQITVLAEHCPCPPEREPLAALAAADPDTFHGQVVEPRTSVLDLLERYRSIELPIETFLGLLPSMRLRRYSISSSAAAQPDAVDLMVSLVEAPRRHGEGSYVGTASHYLNKVLPADVVLAKVIPCSDAFRISPEATAVLISAGTGLAPFRGMIQDRVHAVKAAGVVCYFGCDHPDVDYLHRDELEEAGALGVVDMRPTFALAPVSGHTYVQDRLLADAEEIWSLLNEGAVIRICGDGKRLVPGVEMALRAIFRRCSGTGDEAAAAAWLDGLRSSGQYVADVWAG